ncbi:MAG TPA: hypothetical protein PLS75_10170 [Candidatus Marinimicrobia bacterium]|nr:hypothetical protein [Candidatus Neomarinimicrobiota bacterium]
MSNLIAKDELEQAISMLSNLLQNSPKLDEVILQSGRLNDIKKQIRLGIVDFNKVHIERNRIRAALLSFVGEIEETMEDHPVIKQEVEQIPEAKILVKYTQKHSGTGDNHQYIGGTVHGNHYGHTIQGQGNQLVDVGLDRAVGAVGKEVSKATSTTINLAVKILVIGGIIVSALLYFSYQTEQENNKESEIKSYNETVARLKSDIVNLRNEYPDSPIQTLSDFDNFKIDNTIESERRKEYTVSFKNSEVSNNSFTGRMILSYVCGDDDVFFKNFTLSEFKDISKNPIFIANRKPAPEPEKDRNKAPDPLPVAQLDVPADQSEEMLKLLAGLEGYYVGVISHPTGLNIRDAPSVTNSNVLIAVPYNAHVVVRKLGKRDVINENANYWCWVEYNGVAGWAWMRWIN